MQLTSQAASLLSPPHPASSLKQQTLQSSPNPYTRVCSPPRPASILKPQTNIAELPQSHNTPFLSTI